MVESSNEVAFMKRENAYDFQKRMLIIHQPNLRDFTRAVREGELLLPEQASISMPENADLVIAYINHSYGGAWQTYQHAKRKKKQIINLGNLET